MRRGLWFLAGAGAGVYGMVRARRVKEAFTADGLADRWQALTLGAQMLREEVARGQAEAETQLRERFRLVPHGIPELAGAGGRPMVSSASSQGRLVSTGSTAEPGPKGATQEGEN